MTSHTPSRFPKIVMLTAEVRKKMELVHLQMTPAEFNEVARSLSEASVPYPSSRGENVLVRCWLDPERRVNRDTVTVPHNEVLSVYCSCPDFGL